MEHSQGKMPKFYLMFNVSKKKLVFANYCCIIMSHLNDNCCQINCCLKLFIPQETNSYFDAVRHVVRSNSLAVTLVDAWKAQLSITFKWTGHRKSVHLSISFSYNCSALSELRKSGFLFLTSLIGSVDFPFGQFHTLKIVRNE